MCERGVTAAAAGLLRKALSLAAAGRFRGRGIAAAAAGLLRKTLALEGKRSTSTCGFALRSRRNFGAIFGGCWVRAHSAA